MVQKFSANRNGQTVFIVELQGHSLDAGDAVFCILAMTKPYTNWGRLKS